MRSDVVKKGVAKAPHRSLFKASGLTDEEINKPLIGIVTSQNDIIPGHVNLDKVVEAVKKYHPLFMTGTALMTTTMTAFPKVVDALEKEGLEVPAIGCGGGAVRKDYVESMPMTVYGVEAYHSPKLADAILKNHKTWEDLRKEYSDIVGEFVPEYSN